MAQAFTHVLSRHHLAEEAVPDLTEELKSLLAQIPAGRVTTPGTLAEGLGSRQAAKWIGHYLLHHLHTPECPCHRVVRAGGHLGRFIQDDDSKRALLAAEEIEWTGETIDLARFGFDCFIGSRPLERLQREQTEQAAQISMAPSAQPPRLIAGLDVSYVRGVGMAAYALWELDSQTLVWSTIYSAPVFFPYIPSFLAYRELPLVMGVLRAAREAERLADVLLVDGSGMLHPRGVGIASQVGLAAQLPTIGLTKKLLCGEVKSPAAGCEWNPIFHDGQLKGALLRTAGHSGRPLYVSPGHQIDVQTAATIVAKVTGPHFLPEPIYWADRLSRSAVRGQSAAAGLQSTK